MTSGGQRAPGPHNQLAFRGLDSTLWEWIWQFLALTLRFNYRIIKRGKPKPLFHCAFPQSYSTEEIEQSLVPRLK